MEADPALAERLEGESETYADPVDARLEVDVVGGPPAFEIELAVRLDRLGKRKCRVCGMRRITYALRGYTGSVIISSSPLLCARCAGLVR
jgi:hypothetical protein